MDINYTPVPVICNGKIKDYIADTETYQVEIHQSPNDIFLGPLPVSAIHAPGGPNNYKQGDYVKVLTMFNFGGPDNKFLGTCPASTHHIIGLYNERSIANIKVQNPLTENTNSNITFLNKNTGSGLSIEDNGTTRLASGGVHTFVKGFGYGTNKDSNQTWAQNHKRTIGNNAPYYLSKEHFGLFSGEDLQDESERKDEKDYPIIFRRFVTQSMSSEEWVSTCEGTFAPFFGCNNNFDYVEKSKDVLFTKIINNKKSRITIESGEAGSSFINVRIDDVLDSEKEMIIGKHGASPALLGNRFSLLIDDKGALDIRAAGKGKTLKNNNTHGFRMTVDSEGNLTIHAKGSISLTHGDSDISNNSIVIDPNKGIDITANHGFRVNGIPVVNQNFLDWFDKNKTQLCLVTAIGGPAPLFNLPDFIRGNKLIGHGGFNTDNASSTANGTIKDTINFSSV